MKISQNHLWTTAELTVVKKLINHSGAKHKEKS
jgi:hypothetical protein